MRLIYDVPKMHWLPLLFSSLLIAQDTLLEPGKSYERKLEAGRSDVFTATLIKNNEVSLVLKSESEVIVSCYGPSGRLLRAFSSKYLNGRPVPFLAIEGGAWRFEVAAKDKTKSSAYVLSGFRLEEIKLPQPSEFLTSARIKQIKNQADADQFWKEIESKGSPLIEPIPGDALSSLVTFVWRSDPDSANVLLSSDLCGLWAEPECRMTQVQGTNVWYKSIAVDRRMRTPYAFMVNAPSPDAFLEGIAKMDFEKLSAYERWMNLASLRDPFNKKTFDELPDDPDPIFYRGRSLLEMPAAPVFRWAEKRPDVPTGTIVKNAFSSAILKNSRDIHIYTPAGYSSKEKPYKLLVAFDGQTYINVVPTPVTIDNLLAEKRIAPTVAVMVGNVDRMGELGCSKAFSDFLALELVPWIQKQYHVSSNPRDVIIAGSSLGGLASSCAAYHHPEVFGNVLSQSGSYWWPAPTDPQKPFNLDLRAEPTFATQMYLNAPKKAVRFYLDAGTLEVDKSGRGRGILIPTRHFRDVLRAKEYEVFYQEFHGGHDYRSWRGTLADGLILLQ